MSKIDPDAFWKSRDAGAKIALIVAEQIEHMRQVDERLDTDLCTHRGGPVQKSRHRSTASRARYMKRTSPVSSDSDG